MFNVAHQGIVRWPLTLVQEVNGVFVDVPVTVSFRVFTRKEQRERQSKSLKDTLLKLMDIARKPAPTDEAKLAEREAEILTATEAVTASAVAEEGELLSRIVAWTGFGANGMPADYTPELGRAVIAHEPYFQALWNGLLEASREAKPKNSSPGVAGTSAPGQTTTA